MSANLLNELKALRPVEPTEVLEITGEKVEQVITALEGQPSQTDWSRLAAEEWAHNNDEHELKRDSGLVIPTFTTGQRLRAWVKFRGEPAMRLYETPAAFAARWLAFVSDPAQECVVFHEHEFGQAIFMFREGIKELMYVGCTYPDTSQGRTTPGSIWAGECRCWRYGGPCPKVPDVG